MLDKNCIHADVCSYSGPAFEDCAKCKLRKCNTINTDKQIIDVDKFLKALEKHDADVVESDGYTVMIGYSEIAIQEMIWSCAEHVEETVGVCIEHKYAEEHEGCLISNFECPFCGEWHRQEEVDTYCSHCGKPIMIVRKERKRN